MSFGRAIEDTAKLNTQTRCAPRVYKQQNAIEFKRAYNGTRWNSLQQKQQFILNKNEEVILRWTWQETFRHRKRE